MAMEYYSFERVLKELQMEEDELKRLVSEGEIRAFRDEDKMKFRKSDIDGLKKGRMTEPTIILPTGEPEEVSEDSEVLLVEEDTSETLLDIEDNLESSDSGSTAVPTVDLSSSELEESFSSSSSSSSETITEELTFEEDSGSYVLDSSDDVLIDSSEELPSVDSKVDSREGDSYIDSDTGLQTEPLDLDGSEAMMEHEEDNTRPISEQEDLQLMPLDEKPRRRIMKPVYEEPLSAGLMFVMVAATILLLFSGVFVINCIQEVDTPLTGWLTDIVYENAAPGKHLYKRGQLTEATLKAHMKTRENWRKASSR